MATMKRKVNCSSSSTARLEKRIKTAVVADEDNKWMHQLAESKRFLFHSAGDKHVVPVVSDLQQYVCISKTGSTGPAGYYRQLHELLHSLPNNRAVNLEFLFLSFFAVHQNEFIFTHWKEAFSNLHQKRSQDVSLSVLEKAIQLLMHCNHAFILYKNLVALYPEAAAIPIQASWLQNVMQYGIRLAEQEQPIPIKGILFAADKASREARDQVDRNILITLISHWPKSPDEFLKLFPITWSSSLLEHLASLSPQSKSKMSNNSSLLLLWKMALLSRELFNTLAISHLLKFLRHAAWCSMRDIEVYDWIFFTFLEKLPDAPAQDEFKEVCSLFCARCTSLALKKFINHLDKTFPGLFATIVTGAGHSIWLNSTSVVDVLFDYAVQHKDETAAWLPNIIKAVCDYNPRIEQLAIRKDDFSRWLPFIRQLPMDFVDTNEPFQMIQKKVRLHYSRVCRWGCCFPNVVKQIDLTPLLTLVLDTFSSPKTKHSSSQYMTLFLEEWQPDFVKSIQFQQLFEQRCRLVEDPGDVFVQYLKNLNTTPVLSSLAGNRIKRALEDPIEYLRKSRTFLF